MRGRSGEAEGRHELENSIMPPEVGHAATLARRPRRYGITKMRRNSGVSDQRTRLSRGQAYDAAKGVPSRYHVRSRSNADGHQPADLYGHGVVPPASPIL